MSRVALMLACVAALAGCDKKGTFVALRFTSGPSQPAHSIHCDLMLGGQSAAAEFVAPNGAFTFPTGGTLEIGSGSGAMTVACAARDTAGTSLATVTGNVEVVRDQTVTLSLAFTSPTDMAMPDGAMPDGAMPDGAMPDGAMPDSAMPMPSLSINPTSFGFGTRVIGDSSPSTTFTVSNGGTGPSGTLTVALSGQDAADFELTGGTCSGSSLAIGDSCTVLVRFSPLSANASKSASVDISGALGGSVSATLSGSAATPGALSLSPSSHTFADRLIGTSSTEVPFTLSNTGTSATTSISVSITGTGAGGFTKSSDGCSGMTLAGGASCTIGITFTPGQRGPFAATLSATATTGGTTTADLAGNGQKDVTLVITGAATQGARADLGTVDVGSTGTTKHTFTISNDGDVASGAITLVATGATTQIVPTAANTCVDQMTLAPGASCTGEYVLVPTSFGVKNLDLSFTASPGGSVATYLTGTGRDFITINVANAAGQDDLGVITDTGATLNCGRGNVTCSHTFPRTAPLSVGLLATPDAAQLALFDTWTTPAAPTCVEGASSPSCTLSFGAAIPGGTYAYTASYIRRYTVSFNRRDLDLASPPIGSSLGTVSANSGYTCTAPPCAALVLPAGTSVTVQAGAAAIPGGLPLRRLSAPSCSTSSKNSTPASCTFTLNGNATVSVEYNAHNYAFVSSSVMSNGNLKGASADGLTGADAICAADAAAAHLPGTFRAWLSTTGVDARARLAPANGWVRPDGKPVILSRGWLASHGGLLYPPELDPSGTPRLGEVVFTATDHFGLATNVTGTGPCDDWTNASPDAGTSSTVAWGQPHNGAHWWTAKNNYGPTGCSGVDFRIYCFGVDNDTAVGTPAVGGNKVAFVSSPYNLGSGGALTDLDAHCMADAATPFPSRTFLAFVGEVGQSPGSRFTAGATPWVRPDGVPLTATAAGLLSASPSMVTAFDVQADGVTAADPLPWVWFGAPSPATAASTAATETCDDWATNTSASSGLVGMYTSLDSPFAGLSPSQACDQTARIYCLEP